MKTKLLALTLLIFCATLINAQTKRIEISQLKISTISAKYTKSINIETKDTAYYVYLGFKNAKYPAITDLKSVFLSTDEDTKNLIKDLKSALPEIETKQSIEWKKDLYRLTLYDFSNGLYIYEKPSKGTGYTVISKKEVENLISWLQSFEFGKG
jgi:hypothetical protein